MSTLFLFRFLRDKGYKFSMVNDREFQMSRAVLASKRKELKGKGKGNRPYAAEAISHDELQILKEKGVIGTKSPKQLLNYVWLNNSTLYGIRGGTEAHALRWGDILLKKTETGREYLEYNERLTKTRTGQKRNDQRAFHPKQFAHDSELNCPVFAYKEFKKHRPAEMCIPEAPFYIAVNHNRKENADVWYKCQPVGEGTLRGFMKSMAERAELPGRKTNHSARKTTCTKLLHSGVAPTVIQQLTGHRNVQSVNNYATASIEQQQQMSDILSDRPQTENFKKQTSKELALNYHKNQQQQLIPESGIHTSLMNTQHIFTAESTSSHSSDTSQLFANSRFLNCQITVNVSRSPTQKRRRIRVIESDSE